MTEQTLSISENEAVSATVREALARRRITRQFLADHARISLSTLEKALSGQRPFTLASLVRLEAVLDVPLRQTTPKAEPGHAPGVAPEEFGSYSRPAASWLEGDYVTLRPSFSAPGSIYAYLTTVAWNEEKSHLTFRESERLDAAFTQDGDVSIPQQSGFIYLVTNKHGQYRLVIVSRPSITGEMFGLLTTLQSGRGINLFPVSTPIVFVPLKRSEGDRTFGRIDKAHPRFASYDGLLRRALDDNYASLVTR